MQMVFMDTYEDMLICTHIKMPVYKYLFCVYINSTCVATLDLYVQESVEKHNTAAFRDEMNGCGHTSANLNKSINAVMERLASKLAAVSGCSTETWMDLLEMSLPLELYNDTTYDVEPDFIYE